MSLPAQESYRFGEYTIDTGQRVLLRNGKPVALTPKVFDMLLILVENGGRIVEKEELMNRIWPETYVEEANLTSIIQQLRKALGDNARTPSYIETVARRGYRFIAPVISEDLRPTEDTQPIDDLRSHRGRRRWPLVLGLVALLIAAAASWFFWSHRLSVSPINHGKITLAVLPLKNLTGDEAQEYFSDGLTEEIITQLGNLDPERLGVIARTSVMHYKNSNQSLSEIAGELGVQYVLEGSVRRESDRVRITAQLIQMTDQTHVWAREYDRELNHLLSLQGDIAREVAGEIRLTLSNPKRSKTVSEIASAPNNYEAYDLYLKGLYLWNKRTPESLQQAIDYFQHSILKDPNYARAYSGLANCYALIGGYSGIPQNEFMQKARSAALRAIEIDESLAEAHTSLALIVQNYDWDWQTSEKEFLRAIQLNSNYATAHHWYAEHLMWEGRFDEAFRESELARQLDPLSLIIAADHAVILYCSRQYDKSIQEAREIRAVEPHFPRGRDVLLSACTERGFFTEALNMVEKQSPKKPDPWYWAALAYINGRSGDLPKAERSLEKLLQLNQREKVDAGLMVWACLGLNKKDAALSWLEEAYKQHSNSMIQLKVDPAYDPLRADPRFQDLLRRVGLAE